MTTGVWLDNGTPADRPRVVAACRTPVGTDALVAPTAGPLRVLALPDHGGEAAWMELTFPAGNDAVVVVEGRPAGHGVAAVVFALPDRRVWATTGRADAPGWADLGNPDDSTLTSLAAVEVTAAGDTLRVVAVVSWWGDLWVRVDPSTVRLPIPRHGRRLRCRPGRPPRRSPRSPPDQRRSRTRTSRSW